MQHRMIRQVASLGLAAQGLDMRAQVMDAAQCVENPYEGNFNPDTHGKPHLSIGTELPIAMPASHTMTNPNAGPSGSM